ncbi:glycine zipper 2TM domain-containing protein [Cupriavidus oxalaticus]|uniref:Glycine zipper 2TM domain-containing protein n=1 Tax=Cupriavidus oxalaticus TaxID=96344 RepID=A0A4P7LGB9_9BURK|nr:glycine zipper 2TM domain-containing protein [Cupriavidus oxalaticus]QBY54668.1 glycine zipper 2TM domain-containing protein [Cupriavidus oxalaticus]
MKMIRAFSKATMAGIAVAALATGCADMTPKQRNTVIGAGVGAAGGAALTHGSAAGTLGGAALGGVVGNVMTDDHRR